MCVCAHVYYVYLCIYIYILSIILSFIYYYMYYNIILSIILLYIYIYIYIYMYTKYLCIHILSIKRIQKFFKLCVFCLSLCNTYTYCFLVHIYVITTQLQTTAVVSFSP